MPDKSKSKSKPKPVKEKVKKEPKTGDKNTVAVTEKTDGKKPKTKDGKKGKKPPTKAGKGGKKGKKGKKKGKRKKKKKKGPRCPIKRRKKALKRKCTDMLASEAVLNSYYTSHGVPDMLRFRKFKWKKKKK